MIVGKAIREILYDSVKLVPKFSAHRGTLCLAFCVVWQLLACVSIAQLRMGEESKAHKHKGFHPDCGSQAALPSHYADLLDGFDTGFMCCMGVEYVHTSVPVEDTADLQDPASSSLLLIPTGRSLPSVSGSLGLAAPYIPYAAFSPASGLQLSAGGVYIFENWIVNEQSYFAYCIVKNSLYEDETTHLAVGGALLLWGDEHGHDVKTQWGRSTVLGVFAVATFGNDKNAFTLGMGFANIAEDYGLTSDTDLLFGLGLGYETRLSPHWKFITEHLSNVLSANTLHTLAVRYLVGKAAFDLGIVVIPNADVTISGNRIPLLLPLLKMSVHIE